MPLTPRQEILERIAALGFCGNHVGKDRRFSGHASAHFTAARYGFAAAGAFFIAAMDAKFTITLYAIGVISGVSIRDRRRASGIKPRLVASEVFVDHPGNVFMSA